MAGVMTLCITCNGTKTTDVQVSTFGSDKVEIWNTSCYTCDGTGYITEQKKQFCQEYEEVWCKCTDSEKFETIFIPYNESVYGNDTYLCGKCRKVVQFG